MREGLTAGGQRLGKMNDLLARSYGGMRAGITEEALEGRMV